MYSHVYSTISYTPYYLPKTFWPAPIADYEKGTAAEEAFRPEKTRWEVATSRRLGTTSSIVTSDVFLGFVWPSVSRVQGFNGEFSQLKGQGQEVPEHLQPRKVEISKSLKRQMWEIQQRARKLACGELTEEDLKEEEEACKWIPPPPPNWDDDLTNLWHR